MLCCSVLLWVNARLVLSRAILVLPVCAHDSQKADVAADPLVAMVFFSPSLALCSCATPALPSLGLLIDIVRIKEQANQQTVERVVARVRATLVTALLTLFLWVRTWSARRKGVSVVFERKERSKKNIEIRS